MSCNTCPNCAVATNCNTDADEVFTGALTLNGWPSPGVNNLNVLRVWKGHECGCQYANGGMSAGWNPLNNTSIWNPTTETCCFCNPYVKCYATLSDGIGSLAASWKSNYYPHIANALAHDWTLQEWACDPTIIAEIRTWGTSGFADELVAMGCVTPPPPSCSPPCDACSTCQSGKCVSLCPINWTCLAGTCLPPIVPPIPPISGATVIGIGIVLGGLGLGAWGLWHLRPVQGVVRRVGQDLGGGEPVLGPEDSKPVRVTMSAPAAVLGG